jgi:hypothetical protein
MSPWHGFDGTGTTTISGTITDKTTGHSIAGALISLPQLSLSTESDIDGKFSIPVLDMSALHGDAAGIARIDVEISANAHGEWKFLNLEAGGGPILEIPMDDHSHLLDYKCAPHAAQAILCPPAPGSSPVQQR